MNFGGWIIDNLNAALGVWGERSEELLTVLFTTPQNLGGGGVWSVIMGIHNTMQGIAYALIVMFFFMGMIKTVGSFIELKRPETAFKVFVRVALTNTVVTQGMTLMTKLLAVFQSIMNDMSGTLRGGFGLASSVPQEVQDVIKSMGFLQGIDIWLFTLLAAIVMIALMFIVLLTVYGRFFRLYMYTAISPLALSSFAGEPTSSIGKSFLKSYASVCMEGVIVVLACVIFNAYAGFNTFTFDPAATAHDMTWDYVISLIFNLLIFVGVVKASDRVAREMFGL